ncbi:MAG TPA: chromosomal replication initiator protein DnaA, partial [Candidatus Hodarchaeales archaeon]|nr:chromosomal replication initiator protein DnaA [Candidatus Hodarchaeales archaeon]
WFKPTQFQQLDENNQLIVAVPNQVFEDWLTTTYSGLIEEAVYNTGLKGLRISFQAASVSPAKTERSSSPPPVQKILDFDSVDYLLNPKYTFDRFVVGSSNQFAHAASLAVAESPSRIYNPLFICGGVGLGKTHLMQAVGHRIKGLDRRIRLSYVSSEKFTNEVINAIRYDRTLALREKYRNVDVLLIDDIQFISGKQATQEEFFHTFNDLYDAQKQIVLSSDSLPKEIPDIQERLQSRFESGLIADIQPPDLETKVAILKKKAEFENFDIPDNVAFYIASKIKSNIRELEGSMLRLMAFSSLRGEKVTLSMAQEVLKHILKSQEKHVTIEHIQKLVADYFDLNITELKSRNNSKAVAHPRQIGMYLCRQLTNASLPEIGREFGGKHHTTVLHSIKKVGEKMEFNREFNSLVNKFLDSFQ